MNFRKNKYFLFKNSLFKKEFPLFILAGLIAAFINILSRVILTIFLSFEISVIVAYFLGMFTAFLLTKKFVFKTTKKSFKRSFAAFSLVNLIAIFQTWIVSLFIKFWLLNFISSVPIVELISHSFGVAIPVFTSFFGHKYITFGEMPKKIKFLK